MLIFPYFGFVRTEVPTSVTISETGTGTVTVTGTSDCVFPYSDVYFEWFYVLVLVSLI